MPFKRRAVFTLCFALFSPLALVFANDPPPITVGTTSVIVLGGNRARTSAVITNDGTTKCYLSSSVGQPSGQGIPLNGGQAYIIDRNNLNYGAFFAITASGSTTITIHEEP